MGTALDTAAIPRKTWTREEVLWLAEHQFPHAQRLELIQGELVERMGKKRPHLVWHTLLRQWLEKVFGAEQVQSEGPIDVAPEDKPTSEPEPDLSVTRQSCREYIEMPKPEDLLLIVEIADTTLSYDLQVKGPLYARAGIAEYWVFNVQTKALIIHRAPQNGIYSDVRSIAPHETVSPLAAQFAEFCTDRL